MNRRRWNVEYETLDCRKTLEDLLRGMVDPGFPVLDQKLRNAESRDGDYITKKEFKKIWRTVREDLDKEDFGSILRYCELSVDKDGKTTVDCENFLQFLNWVRDEYRIRNGMNRVEENQNQ